MAQIEKIRTEIERLINDHTDGKHVAEADIVATQRTAFQKILSFIDSMQEEHCRLWRQFSPFDDLPKERVSIAYDTHDERRIRYAYGYFQFHNGTCICFWKDGNEQPKSVKAEDIRYWMPVFAFDSIQEGLLEESASEELNEEIRIWQNYFGGNDGVKRELIKQIARHFANWQERQMMKYAMDGSLINDGGEYMLVCPSLPTVTREMDEGDRVKIIIRKEQL